MNQEHGSRTKLVVLTAALLAIAGCGSSARTSSQRDATVVLSANLLGTPVATLVVEVTASDIATPLFFNLTVTNGIATGTLHLPPGAARTIDVQAFDSTGAITHEGTKTIDVSVGPNPPVSIAMVPRSGLVPITVVIGPVGVVVQPAVATIDVGATLQLAATITAANGDVLPGPADWATSDPVVATVDATGLVTGLSDGTAQIVATYAGVAAVSQITVGVPACAGCAGAICGGVCTDLSGALSSEISSALPASFCFPQQTVSLATVCGGQSCGGGSGCTVNLAWGPVVLDPATGQLTGTVAASSNVDISLLGSSCTVALTADASLGATAALVCAVGSEAATISNITATLTGSSISGCGDLSAILDTLAPLFTSTAESQAAAALAGATTSLSATCP